MSCCFKYIGYVKREDNSQSRRNVVKIVVDKDYEEGLRGIEDYSHLIIIYHLHLSQFDGNLVRDFHEGVRVGVFATRTHERPNPIGISVVELLKVEGNVLHVRGINAVDGTPVLDIKPYDYFDRVESIRVPEWWLKKFYQH
ncbi:methyltransferase [Sulfolobus acidocaldarius SUSAZ]|nr:methyltransferase [Sulfolobus acidocaldarius SUSAZ]